jgi:uncharacterized membrane protein YeiB
MSKRADALDALRGFAIMTMILSGSIPFSGPAALPGWMYHAQLNIEYFLLLVSMLFCFVQFV